MCGFVPEFARLLGDDVKETHICNPVLEKALQTSCCAHCFPHMVRLDTSHCAFHESSFAQQPRAILVQWMYWNFSVFVSIYFFLQCRSYLRRFSNPRFWNSIVYTFTFI
jgi:hypothetical protein